MKTEGTISILPISIRRVLLRVVGDSELITHNWSEKAKKEMRDSERADHFDFKARRDTGPSEVDARLEEAEATEPVREGATQTDRRATRQAKQAGLEGMS
jgi:hypothetical protein